MNYSLLLYLTVSAHSDIMTAIVYYLEKRIFNYEKGQSNSFASDTRLPGTLSGLRYHLRICAQDPYGILQHTHRGRFPGGAPCSVHPEPASQHQ